MAGVIRSKNNPVVFFDIAIGNHKLGRLKMELFADVVPKTAQNFRQMCTGQFIRNGKPTGFKNCPFHRITKQVRIEGGDFINQDGTGCISIYGESFDDQNFMLNHDEAGLLSMVMTLITQTNSAKNKNGCQFFITLGRCQAYDGKNVVFGKIIDEQGMNILKQIEATPVNNNLRPKSSVTIIECGQL